MPRLNELYAENMKNHPYGYALYHPTSTRDLYPGCVGYFDTLGNWHPVTHVETASAPYKRSAHALDLAPQSTLTWPSPLCSSSVRACTAGISSEALPAGASCRYVSSTAFGAVLATAGEEVVRDSYYHSAPFREWLRNNAQALIKARPEVRDHGVWVVASTYSTRKCSIVVWTSRDVEAAVGIMAVTAALGPLGGRKLNCNATESAFEAKEERERLVVFVGGVRFTYSRLLRRFRGVNRRIRMNLSETGNSDLEDEQKRGWVFGETDNLGDEQKRKRVFSETGDLEDEQKRKRMFRGADDLEDEQNRKRVFSEAGDPEDEQNRNWVSSEGGDSEYEQNRNWVSSEAGDLEDEQNRNWVSSEGGDSEDEQNRNWVSSEGGDSEYEQSRNWVSSEAGDPEDEQGRNWVSSEGGDPEDEQGRNWVSSEAGDPEDEQNRGGVSSEAGGLGDEQKREGVFCGADGRGGKEERERGFHRADNLEHGEYKFVVEDSYGEPYEVTCVAVGVVGGEDTAGQGGEDGNFEHGVLARPRGEQK